ncbi:SusC/RagA family TonB-linked outer membrane protein [Paraflavitalea soli]|uniref:SusC/RagA family TonB-linked outer membrane protein n=1 Tax=Paraflavitalea soli TaxID=2315862 RepID=A0A3B7MRL3_9BACT|nr:SusC/RagA family TonB-linked outer membrane protein [Paraflavitalea soli]AXY77174.1 SusC/RagA family TonB-linked outer membrane protein [Paraflavitalea soli]
MRKAILVLLCVALNIGQLLAQTRTITGKVTDPAGLPLSGVTIIAKGAAGTTTASDGTFKLSVPGSVKVISLSAVGYEGQELSVVGKNEVIVSMKVDNQRLEEVVVTGYGSRRKAEFTGAVSRVSSKKIEQVPMASFEQILQGRAPGLYIASGSGQPGSYARVNIRGVGTLGNGTDPLYILDGMPIEAGVFRTMNPNDFETVDVLKDAAGASLYGSRGANGVIVITSKKGKSGKAQLQFRTQHGVNTQPTIKYDMMNTDQRLQFEETILGPGNILPVNGAGLTGYPGWDYSKNNPRYGTLTPAQQQLEAHLLDSIKGINTDWADHFFRDGKFHSYELNASGGNQGMNYYTSLSAYNQEGIVLRSNLDRYTFRGNLDFKTDRLTVAIRSSAGWSKQSGIESEAGVALANPIAAAYLSLPYVRLFNNAGLPDVKGSNIGANAYDRLFTTTSLINQFKGTLGITATYAVWGGIGLRTTAGVDYRNNNTSRYIDPRSFAGTSISTGNRGSYNEGNNENLQLMTSSGLTFNRTFNSVHTVNAQALLEFISNRYRAFNATGYGLNTKLGITPAAITAGSTTNNMIPTIGGSKTRNALYSLVGVADYSYDKKYTLSASLRRDAPSQVPEGNRNNIFWSVGASWNIMAEDFMASQNFLNDLRLRASYGSSGNANGFSSDYGYITSYGSGGYAGVTGIVPSSPGNPSYKLESQAIANIGVDLSAWNNRLRATVEWYNKKSKNLFASQPISRSTGFLTLSTNAAEVKNTGVEALVAVDVISNKDWTVTIGGNVAYLKNEITSLGSLSEFTAGTGIYRVGLPIGTHYTVGWIGVDPQTGDAIYQDINGNPTSVYSASNNRAAFGTYIPKYTGGANLDARYKNFDFSVLFSFAEGVKRYNNERFFYELGNNGVSYNMTADMLNAWTKPGQVTNFQRVGAGSTRQFSSKDINDASFIRLRNMQAGYTFNFKNPSKAIRGFRIYAQAQNLLTWTKWQGFDPEESNNIATYEFPNPRSYTFGVDVNF